MIFIYITDLRSGIIDYPANFPLSSLPYLHKQILELASLNTSDSTTKHFIIDKSPFDEEQECFLTGRILPKSEIYNRAAYRIRTDFPSAYPLIPPYVRFLTRIYHPNVDKNGV